MSMYLDSESVQSSFFIGKNNIDNAFKTLMQALDEKPELCRMDRDYRNSKQLEELIEHCSWRVALDADGNICGIKHWGTNVSEEDLLFTSLSPFVKSGSYIEYTREGSTYNQKYRYDFHDSKITITEWFEKEGMDGGFYWEDGDSVTIDLSTYASGSASAEDRC